ncbi:hypothetical protein [uncultured Eubacterium sp.]|jgi:hypothetical protein|uniref:hypothetical protein n=1 Tax=uncultured Eubacterium sp. TaxID=165185 RepID=UPI00326719AC
MPKEALNILKEIWEIFKSLLPLTVALITIFVNNRNQRKKQQYDKRVKYVDDIQQRIMELNSLIWGAGADILEAIQRVENIEEHNHYMEKYLKDIQLMLIRGREIKGICEITSIILKDKSCIFEDMFDMLRNLNKKYLDVISWYNEQAGKTPLRKFEELCDQAQCQLIDISQEAEESLINFCIKIKS